MRSPCYTPWLCFFLLLVSASAKTQQHPGRRPPNIILILADDLGYGDLGCYGQQKIATPNIDRMAAEGLRFTRFYAGTAVCAPSRASLLTGMHTGHTPVRGNRGTKPEGQFPLPDSVLTIAGLLREHGYATAAFGKWGLGFITTTGDPNRRGFDRFFGYNCQTLAHNYFPDHLWDNHHRVDFPGNDTGNAVYSADYIHRQAMQFLAAKHDKPFFLYLPYTLPHGDVIAPHDSVYRNYVRKFGEAPRKQNSGSGEHRFEPYPHAAFATMVDRLDRYTAEILQAVKQQGILENTLVIFTSDNGPHRENGGDPEFFDSNGPLRGIKRDLYEGGIRIPFIAYWPGKIKPGTSDFTGAFWDIYPTFAALAGPASTKKTDGVSLLPTLFRRGKQQQHAYLYWEFHENGGRQAVLWKNWKGVKLEVGRNADAPMELYNLAVDGAEQHNAAGTFPEVVRQLDKIMKAAHVPNPDWPLLQQELK